MGDHICKVFTAHGMELTLKKVLSDLEAQGCQRPWQSIGMALHYGFLILEIRGGEAFLKCVRRPIPVPVPAP